MKTASIASCSALAFEPLDYFAQRSDLQISLRKFAFQRALAHASLLKCAF